MVSEARRSCGLVEEDLDELEVETEEREGARNWEREEGSYFIDHSHLAGGRRTE